MRHHEDLQHLNQKNSRLILEKGISQQTSTFGNVYNIISIISIYHDIGPSRSFKLS